MKVAIYTRISTDLEGQPYSLEAQRDRLEAYAESQGWKIVRHYSDQASGAKLDRPDLQRALKEAKAGVYELLLVVRVDRVARSVLGLADIVEELEQAGVRFASASESFDTSTPAGRMMCQLLGAFAEFERASIIERVIAGLEKKASRGEWMQAHAPLGYRKSEDGKALVVDEDEAPIVLEIFRRYTDRLEGTLTISKWLNDRGYRTRNGKRFSPQAVGNILKNRAYIAEILYRGKHHAAPHTPLVSESVFSQAQQTLGERGEDPSLRRSNASDYFLTGRIHCARCGKRYVGASAHGRSARYRYYVCNTNRKYGAEACDGESIPADDLEAAIMEQLVSVLENEPLVREEIGRAFGELEADRPKRAADLAALDAEIRNAQAALDRYFRAFEDESLPIDACGPRIEELHQQIAGLQARREELVIDADDTLKQLTPSEVHALATDVARILAEGDFRQKKAVLQGFVREVRVVSRDEIYPSFTIPAVRPPDGSVAPGGYEQQVRELEMRAEETASWRYGPSVTILPAPGCYAFQVDGTDFSEVIVFEAARASKS